jgi:hypothetical protein
MAATLLRRALQLRRVLPSPSSRALLPAASSRLLSTTNSTQQNTTAIPIDLSSDESRRRLVNRYPRLLAPSSESSISRSPSTVAD